MGYRKLIILVGLFIYQYASAQQVPTRTINSNIHFWTSVNSTFRFENNWGIMADAHIRRTNFVSDPSFYFARVGAVRWFNNQTSAALGYGNLISPSVVLPERWNVEHRIYQQVLHSSKVGPVNMLQRLRNEQRWRYVPESKDNPLFTNRIRYLLSLTIPVFQKSTLPALVIADELLMHWGKSIAYNPLDQNRLFIGIRQPLGKQWSYDAGYMYVFQQKNSGNFYDVNHTVRLFFYYSFNQQTTFNEGSE